MDGKLFPDSTGPVEDMARVMFDYFKAAAQRVVSEEIVLEQKIEEQKQLSVESSRRQQSSLLRTLIAAGVVVVLSIGGLVAGLDWVLVGGLFLAAGLADAVYFLVTKSKETKAQGEVTNRIRGFTEAHQAIRRDFQVHRIGTAYVPVASLVPFQGRSFLLDHTGSQPNQEFRLSDIKDKEELRAASEALDHTLTHIPMVDSGEDSEAVDSSEDSASIPRLMLTDWAAQVDRQVRRLKYVFSDLEESSVQIPIIGPTSALAAFLMDSASDSATARQSAVLYNTAPLQSALEQFAKLAELSEHRATGSGKDVDEFCRDLMTKVATTFQLVSEGRRKSLLQITNYGAVAFGSLLKGSFNYYSASLEAETLAKVRNEQFNFSDGTDKYEPLALQRSSRVTYDPVSDNWVGEDGSRTSHPFGIHQLFEEVFMPMVEHLMQENRLERLKVYNHIKDQKIDYLNQWHRDTEDFYARNRAEINELSNRIRSITSEYLSDLNTYKALSQTILSMGTEGLESSRVEEVNEEARNIEALQGQAMMFQNFIDQFNARFENYQEQIQQLSEAFEHIEYYEASLRDGEARNSARALNKDDWEERRKKLLGLGPQIAAGANLPPEAEVSDAVERDSLVNLVAHLANVMAELNEADRSAQSEAV